MAIRKRITSAQILEKTMAYVAPLPSQEAYIKDLATIMAMHINRNMLIDKGYAPDALPAPSAIVVASTGQGKTYLLRKMAECLDLNVITVDCSTLVGENYKGVSLSQRIACAMNEAKNEKAFRQSLLFFDEVDKLCTSGTIHASGMTSILQLFNGGSVAVGKNDSSAQSVDVSRFTVLMGGAFVGLEKIIQARLCPRAKIGFGQDWEKKTDAQWLQAVTAEDLAQYGMMWELLGRIGTILVIPPLGIEDYRQLLNAQTGSVREKYDNFFFGLYGVHFEISDAGIDKLSRKSTASHMGARVINQLVDDLVRPAIAKVEENSSICKVILDADADNCCIRYVYGEREGEPAEVQPKQQEALSWHTVKAKNAEGLIRKLCRYYRNAGADGNTLEQLEAFLGCAIPYLQYGCREEEFNFDSLQKLAGASHRENGSSVLDNLLRNFIFIPKDNRMRFDAAYTSWMRRNVTTALQAIVEYLREKHKTDKIRFVIEKK